MITVCKRAGRSMSKRLFIGREMCFHNRNKGMTHINLEHHDDDVELQVIAVIRRRARLKRNRTTRAGINNTALLPLRDQLPHESHSYGSGLILPISSQLSCELNCRGWAIPI
jgi:hypothetical protein